MLYLVIAAAIVAADRLTKVLAVKYLTGAGELETIPGVLHLCLSYNSGASLGMLGGRRALLVALSAVASAFIIYLIVKRKFDTRPEKIGLAFVLGGAVGNLIDRAASGLVTDMLIFPWIGKIPLLPDFICNVADIFITFGAVVFLVGYVVGEIKKERAAKAAKLNAADD